MKIKSMYSMHTISMDNNSGYVIITYMRFDKNGKRISGKTINTPFGRLDLGNKEAKEEFWAELEVVEEAKRKEAQRMLHSRMSQFEREEATKWLAFYRYMVDDDKKE